MSGMRLRNGEHGYGVVTKTLHWVTVLLLDDDWLPLHVGAHVAFFAALAAHLTLVLRHRLIPRML